MSAPDDPLRILVVEDSRVMRSFIKKSLARPGDRLERIWQAADGVEAIEMLEDAGGDAT